MQFFKDSWILLNYNSNNVVLIPKYKDVECINHYRPTTMANFKHKIITMTLADKLYVVTSNHF